MRPITQNRCSKYNKMQIANSGLFFILLTLILLTISTTGYAKGDDPLRAITTTSPNHKLAITVTYSSGGKLHYTFTANGETLILPSSLGLSFGQAEVIPSKGWRIKNVTRRSVHKVWRPVWGKSSRVPNRYNETAIELQGPNAPFNTLFLVIRVYDDGVAFRYKIPSGARGKTINCKKELTTFHFSGDYTAWFYNGPHDNLGPVELTEVSSKRRPVMTIKVGAHDFMAILEADLRTGNPILLHSQMGQTTFSIISGPGPVRPGYRSSWRVILYGEAPGVLVDSHTVQLLNPPPADRMDFSWVEPGIALWDWRLRGAKVGGFEYSANYASWVRLVDFAAKHDIPYVQLDAGWYGPTLKSGAKTTDPIHGGKSKTVKKLIDYAKSKGVRILLYINDVDFKSYSIEYILKQYHQWGAAGLKIGFMRGSPAYKNKRTRKITKLAAKYHLLVDFHDHPVIPYGQMRTWPNAITREYCDAQLDAHNFTSLQAFVTSVYVNMLAGPLDMNNGIFNLLPVRSDAYFESMSKPTIPSTVTSEAARTLIVFSGLTVIPDIPENYEKFPELFSFIMAENQPWQQSKTLMGKIGKYIVMARQASGGTWLVGAVTNPAGRTLTIPLGFLGKGTYKATIIQDGNNASYLANRTAYKVDKQIVTAADSIKVRLAPGGGACIMIKKSV